MDPTGVNGRARRPEAREIPPLKLSSARSSQPTSQPSNKTPPLSARSTQPGRTPPLSSRSTQVRPESSWEASPTVSLREVVGGASPRYSYPTPTRLRLGSVPPPAPATDSLDARVTMPNSARDSLTRPQAAQSKLA